MLPEGVSSDEYLELSETAPKGFDPAKYGAKTDNLEGFLFPATYELGPNSERRRSWSTSSSRRSGRTSPGWT